MNARLSIKGRTRIILISLVHPTSNCPSVRREFKISTMKAVALLALLVLVTASAKKIPKAQPEEGAGDIGILVNYEISQDSVSWVDAKEQCRSWGGTLYSPLASDYDATLKELLVDNNFGNTLVWTDGKYVNGNWLWTISGRGYNYNNWKKGTAPVQPDLSVPEPRCIAAGGEWTEYGWITRSCNDKLRFICKFTV